jgi:hypothetical protein
MTDLATLDGVGQRASSFRFALLDKQNSLLESSLPIDEDSAPTITNNINRAVKRSMSNLVLPPSVTADVNTLTERVQPWMRFQDGTEYPCGVFLFGDAVRQLVLSGSVQLSMLGEAWKTTATMLDQLVTINQGSRGINFYGPGASIYDAFVQQLDAAGIFERHIDVTDAVFSDWVVWKPNTNRLKVVNDLAAMVGFYSLYFDNSGVAQLRKVPAMEAVEPDFIYEAGLNVFADTITESDDLLGAYNSYVVVNSGFNGPPIWGEWLVPPSADHSYDNRGFYVVKEIDQQGITSNAQARIAAKAAGQADFAAYRWANFAAAINPLHDTFNVVQWLGDKWREQAHDFVCREGSPHKHELRRVWSDDFADIIEEEA